MHQGIKTAFVGLTSALLLTSCFQNRGPLPSQNASNVSAQNVQAAAQPVFGNTLTNIKKIQSKPYNGTLRFVMLGDNRNSNPFSTGGNKIYKKVIDQINQLNPDFAINLGDFTFDALKPHWRTFEKITSASRVPYLTVVGNHDIIFGRSYYESNYTQPNAETGLDDYSFDYGNARFIALDTANYTYTDRQLVWLEKQLNTPLKKFVFTHTPPRYGVWNHKLAPSPEASARFMKLMETYKPDFVLMGHVHLYDQRKVNGVNYMVSGGAGAPLERGKGFGQSVYHVAMIEVKGDQVSHRLVPIDTRIQTQGPTAFSDGITPAEMNMPGRINFPQDLIPPEEQN